MADYITAEFIEQIKKKIELLQAKRRSGYGSELLTHEITNDPEEKINVPIDTTSRDIKNYLIDINDYFNYDATQHGSALVNELIQSNEQIDKLMNATEANHGCRGACAGLCTGTCIDTCSGCKGGTAGTPGCGTGNCSGGCRSGCTGTRA